MAFTLWLSAEEERILEKIMRVEGTRNKEQAVIKAIRDKGAQLASLPATDAIDEVAVVSPIDSVAAPVPALLTPDVAMSTLVVGAPAFATLDTRVTTG